MEDVLGIIFLFGGGTLFLLAISPIGRAIADRIRARGVAGAAPAVAGLEERVAQLSTQVSELAERLDFAERLLAERRERKLTEGPHGNL